MGSDLEKRATESESRIVQALKGKKLSKGSDGQWRLQELDRSELSADT